MKTKKLVPMVISTTLTFIMTGIIAGAPWDGQGNGYHVAALTGWASAAILNALNLIEAAITLPPAR